MRRNSNSPLAQRLVLKIKLNLNYLHGNGSGHTPFEITLTNSTGKSCWKMSQLLARVEVMLTSFQRLVREFCLNWVAFKLKVGQDLPLSHAHLLVPFSTNPPLLKQRRWFSTKVIFCFSGSIQFIFLEAISIPLEFLEFFFYARLIVPLVQELKLLSNI